MFYLCNLKHFLKVENSEDSLCEELAFITLITPIECESVSSHRLTQTLTITG